MSGFIWQNAWISLTLKYANSFISSRPVSVALKFPFCRLLTKSWEQSRLDFELKNVDLKASTRIQIISQRPPSIKILDYVLEPSYKTGFENC